MKPSRWLLTALPAALVAALAAGCDDGGGEAPIPDARAPDAEAPRFTDGGLPIPEELPTARFILAEDPATTRLGDIPFPSDLYRTADGRLDLRGFPNRTQGSILERILLAIEADTDGFGTSSTMYMAFDGVVDPTALPRDSAASFADDSTLMLVDIDPDSPERGNRWPINWQIVYEPTLYLPANGLSVRLVEGFALRPETTYALIATTAATDPSPEFRATIGPDRPDGALGRAWDVHAPLREWIAESGASVANAAVFTTQDPVGELFRARDYLHTLPPPTILTVQSQGVRDDLYELFTGTYRAPRFQEGTPPYRTANTGPGAMRFGPDGDPIVQGEEELRFSLSIPTFDDAEMPPDGWPVVLYGHGTGGDYLSFISARVAASLSQNGIAVLSIDQIHHGPRDPRPNGCQQDRDPASCVGLSFFNFAIPAAGRDNVRQSALDFVSLLRLARGFEIAADVSTRGRPVRLDPDKIMYMGHSQGGINGPLFLAIEPLVLGGVLSAAGSTIAISIEQKTRPVDINHIVKSILPLGNNDVLDRWHPTLMLLQMYIEKGDPVNYARFWFHEPPVGYAPKSIFMTAGLQDEYTPPDAILALAAAGRVPIIEPVLRPIEMFTVFGIDPAGLPPYEANVAGGAASAGVAQFGDLGHFVIQDSVSARGRYRQFIKSLADGRPRIY
ncbi:MAG: alpha/beta fold hydrolase [bacterium]